MLANEAEEAVVVTSSAPAGNEPVVADEVEEPNAADVSSSGAEGTATIAPVVASVAGGDVEVTVSMAEDVASDGVGRVPVADVLSA